MDVDVAEAAKDDRVATVVSTDVEVAAEVKDDKADTAITDVEVVDAVETVDAVVVVVVRRTVTNPRALGYGIYRWKIRICTRRARCHATCSLWTIYPSQQTTRTRPGAGTSQRAVSSLSGT